MPDNITNFINFNHAKMFLSYKTNITNDKPLLMSLIWLMGLTSLLSYYRKNLRSRKLHKLWKTSFTPKKAKKKGGGEMHKTAFKWLKDIYQTARELHKLRCQWRVKE